MFKRQENSSCNDNAVPAKRPKYNLQAESTTVTSARSKNVQNKKSTKSDDIWGDDFADTDIEEMDFVASQAILQDDAILTQTNKHSVTPEQSKQYLADPCCSKNLLPSNFAEANTLKPSTQMHSLSQASQVIYADFKKNIVNKAGHNSTFWVDDNALTSNDKDTILKELERLKDENKKLLNDFITKDGETTFLRKQLQQVQLQVEGQRLEKTRAVEEQAKKYISEIGMLSKENDHLKTQLDLQKFEVGNLAERCKLLENGHVKLTQPQPANFNFFKNQEKLNQSINRLSLSNKVPEHNDVSVQATSDDRQMYTLRTSISYYPLANIPKLIFDVPQPEKPIVDIQVVEKTGRRNLPILQEEDTFRIFENPDLVKPLITVIDGKKLTTEFVLSEVACLQTMTDLELESDKAIPIINKLVSTARELILNLIIVLHTISQAMTNDDIRDMNDVYFSDLYLNLNYNMKSPCDSHAWHEGERGIEARRVFGLLSYVALESTYLCNYISGNTQLIVELDEEYTHYSQQMTRYNAWSKKGHQFEMMEIFSQFASLLDIIRRSHQFSGLIYAITNLIYNVHKKVDFSSGVLDYIFRIFKDFVFSRPLVCCYASLTKIMIIFVKSKDHLKKLCLNSQTTAISDWRGSLHFSADACPLQIFLVQMESYDIDIISAIDITGALLLFIESTIKMNVIPLKSDNPVSCNCYVRLMRFTVKYLYKSSEKNLNMIKDTQLINSMENGLCNLKEVCDKHSKTAINPNKKCLSEIYPRRLLNHEFWTLCKRKQLRVVSDGIRFLYRLVICDADYVIRLPETEDSLHLFIKNMNAFGDILHINESEALKRIKQTLVFDRGIQSEATASQQRNTTQLLDIRANFKNTSVNPGSKNTESKVNYDRTLAAFQNLFNTESSYDSC